MKCSWGFILMVWVTISVAHFRCISQASDLGARSVALSGVSTSAEDLWSAANNPAGLAGLKCTTIGFCLEQAYAMKELGNYGIVAAMPIGNHTLGIFGLFNGYSQFIRQDFGIAYGRAFGDHFKAGLGLLYRYQKSPDCKPVHLATYHLGAVADLSAKLKLGFSAFNPFQAFYRSEDYVTMASLIRLAISYHFTPSLLITAELEKDMDLKPVLKIGMEYLAGEIFIIRGGFRLFPASWSFGAAFHYKKSLIEIAACYHYYLGFTPAISMQYFLGQ